MYASWVCMPRKPPYPTPTSNNNARNLAMTAFRSGDPNNKRLSRSPMQMLAHCQNTPMGRVSLAQETTYGSAREMRLLASTRCSVSDKTVEYPAPRANLHSHRRVHVNQQYQTAQNADISTQVGRDGRDEEKS